MFMKSVHMTTVPDKYISQKMIIDKKKRELLSQYASETLVQHLE